VTTRREKRTTLTSTNDVSSSQSQKRYRSAQTKRRHLMLDITVLPLFSLCSLPTTVSAVIGNEERGSLRSEGPCGTACCHSWVPTPFRPTRVDVTARSDVSAVLAKSVCASDVRRTLFLLVFSRERLGGGCGKEIVNRCDALLYRELRYGLPFCAPLDLRTIRDGRIQRLKSQNKSLTLRCQPYRRASIS